MSKKCCGMIYADEDTVCKICGKTLKEETQDDEKINITQDSDEYSRMKDETDRIVADVLRMQEEAEHGGEQEPEEELQNDAPLEEIEESVESSVEVEDENISEDGKISEDEDILEDEDEDFSVRPADRASGAVKTAGVLAIIAAVLGMTAVVLGVIFFALFPGYRKHGNADTQMNFPEMATGTDAAVQRPTLTPTDATIEVSFDAGAVATDTDADTQSSETGTEETE